MSDYLKNLLDDEKENKEELGSSTPLKNEESTEGLKKVELYKKVEKAEKKSFEAKDEKINRPLILSLIVIVILIPLTVIVSYLLKDTHYYIASVIILILAMIPFFVNFEHKKYEARKLVLLAVLVAITIALRVVFMWIPYFTPMAGMIIITAIAFGPQTGFMTGALSIIVSNMIFGQGPWTPWQMFCYGLIGFIAGLLSKPEILSQMHKIRTAVISFLIVFVLSGLILDTCTIFLSIGEPLEGGALAVYLAGVPVNAITAGASAVFVILFLKPMMDKLERLKVKYGI